MLLCLYLVFSCSWIFKQSSTVLGLPRTQNAYLTTHPWGRCVRRLYTMTSWHGKIHWSPTESLTKGQRFGPLFFYSLLAWISCWTNIWVTGDYSCDTTEIILERSPISTPDNKFHVVHMGPTWVLSSPGGPHVGPMNLALRDCLHCSNMTEQTDIPHTSTILKTFS